MKRHIGFREISLVLIALLVFGMLGACQSAATTAPAPASAAPQSAAPATAADEEPYNVQMLVEPTKFTNSKDTVIGKAIYDKFKINFELISYSGDIREKQNLMLAAKDYNELQYMQRDDMVLNYIKAGALLELDQYLPQMPNFTARFKDVIPYWRLSGDGKLYKWEGYVPRNLDIDVEVNDMFVRTDALEAQGWKMPRSASEWVAFLKEAVKTMKDVDGKPVVGLTLPMAEAWGLAGLVPCLYEKGDTYQAIGNEAFTWNLKTEQYEDYFKAPPVKDSIKFFNTLYREGLLDEECFTDTLDKSTEKLNKGQAIVGFYIVWVGSGVNQELVKSGNEKMQYINLPIQSDAQVAAGEKREIRVEASRPFNSYGLTVNCKQPERLLKLIDYISGDEGQILTRSGVEGVHWKTEDGKRVITQERLDGLQDGDYSLAQGFGVFVGTPVFNMLAADGQPHDLTNVQSFSDANMPQRQREAFQALGWASSKSWYMDNGFFAPSGLSTTVYIDPTTDLGKTGTKMTELRTKYTTKLIMAKDDAEFESIWQQAMTEYDKLNPQAYIDEMNKQLEVSAKKLAEYRSK